MMNSENIKLNQNVEIDFTSNNVEVSNPSPKVTIPKTAHNLFYYEVSVLILLAFTSNLVFFIMFEESLVLIIGIVLSCVIIILLLLNFIIEHIHPCHSSGFMFPIVYFASGLCFVFEDPDVIRVFMNISTERTYLPGLLTLILLTITVSHKTAENSNFLFANIALGMLSFCIVVSLSEGRGQIIYLFITLLIVLGEEVRKILKKRKRMKVTKYEDIPIDKDYDLEFEEITTKLVETADYLTQIMQKPENLADLATKSIINIKSISLCLQNKSNIYSAKPDKVTKNMDEQDKMFIEESCFNNVFNNSMLSNSHAIRLTAEISYGVNELSGMLKNISRDWNFNSFFFADCCGSTPIQVAGYYVFHSFNLDEVFKIPESLLKCFLTSLEGTYKPNPYHNATHAADVMCSDMFLMCNSRLFDVTTSLDMFASIVAALGHDAGHPAKNNRFLVITRNELAIEYNDISVLEMMHTSIIFQIINKAESNIFINLTTEQWCLARKLIIEMILATDMSKHFDLMGQFKGKYKTKESFDVTNTDMKVELFRLIIKAADIGHAAKNIELHEKWCKLVVEEFYTQGDVEKELGVAVSMYCDRETTDISKSQAGFIKNIVLPLFTAINFVLCSELIESCCIEQLKVNENFWISRRKGLRGKSVIMKHEEYVNRFNNLVAARAGDRKPSLPGKYIS